MFCQTMTDIIFILRTLHSVEVDSFIKSQLASRSQLSGLIWCKFGHVTTRSWGGTKPSYFTEWTVEISRGIEIDENCWREIQ